MGNMSEVRKNRRIGMICEEMPELNSLMVSAFSVGLSLGAAKR